MKISHRILSILLAVVLLIGAAPITASARGSIMYGIGFVNTDDLKLRSEASTTASIVDTAAKNECVVVVSKSGSWYKVIYNLQEGYMHKDYLDVLTRENAELGYGEVNGSNVNLRSGAGTFYRSVARAAKGAKVYIIGLNSGWYKVIYGSNICYIRSDYVDLTEIPYENQDSSNSPLFFRLGKSTGTAPSASALKNSGSDNSSNNTTSGGISGVITNGTVETKPAETKPVETQPVETKPAENTPVETKPAETTPPQEEIVDTGLMYGIGFVNASALRLRSSASTSSAIVATASRNECVVVVSKTGEWYKVIYNLKEGYMHSDYVNVLTKENAELGYGKINADGVTLHSGVGSNYKTVATADKGDKAYIIGLNTGWYKVIFEDYVCYVPSDKLDLTEIPYENYASPNSPRFFRLGKSLGVVPSANALKNESSATGSGISTAEGQAILNKAKQYLGVPYVWGGASPSGFDCSGLVYYVLKSLGYSTYRTPADQYRQGVYVPKSELQPGDIVYFANTYGSGISHVGIYAGDGKFIHSPNSRSVVSYADLTSGYWANHYYGARRMTK